MSKSKKYYWLKLKEDFFSQPRIKQLRRIAGGDTYTLIYQKIMLLSIKNQGIVKFQGIEPTLEQELSLILDENVDNVEMVLSFMRSAKLMEQVDDNEYLIPDVIHLIGSNTDAAERMKRMRERNNVTAMLPDVTHIEERREKKEERRKKKEEKRDKIEDKRNQNIDEFDFTGFNNDEINSIKDWLQHKKERKEPYKTTGLKGLRTKMLELSRLNVLCSAITDSIACNYAGVGFRNSNNNYNKKPNYLDNIGNKDYANDEGF